MIEILEKKIYFSGYGTSKYRCKWKYTNELGISAGMSKNAEMSQNRDCRTSFAKTILAPASAPEIASGVNEGNPSAEMSLAAPASAPEIASSFASLTSRKDGGDRKDGIFAPAPAVRGRMQYELINMIDPANYGGYVVVEDYYSENSIFTGTVVIYYD